MKQTNKIETDSYRLTAIRGRGQLGDCEKGKGIKQKEKQNLETRTTVW